MKIVTFCLFILFVPFTGYSQTGIITTVAGNGSMPASGDGGLATAAGLGYTIWGIALDDTGNLFISAGLNIRKVKPNNIISTIYSSSSQIHSILPDHNGNLYFSEMTNHVITKLFSSGIIDTIAGIGTAGSGSSGFPATATLLNDPRGLGFDTLGNLYLLDNANSLRVITISGILNTLSYISGGPAGNFATVNKNTNSFYYSDGYYSQIRIVHPSSSYIVVAGNGISGYSGDGGLAVNATLNAPSGIATDVSGNVYFSDCQNHVIRKIDTKGIITTIAGTGVAGFSGDGGSALLAMINHPSGLTVDPLGKVYFADADNKRIRKIDRSPTYISDSFTIFVNKECSGADIWVQTNSYSSGLSVTTYFGDGTNFSSPIFSTFGNGYAHFNHKYAVAGNYSVKHILYNGAIGIDSFFYTYNQLSCTNIFSHLYYDANGNCSYDVSDSLITTPSLIAIDSNGVTLDTLSVLSGFYYSIFGNSGDIYKFRLLSTTAPGLYSSCGSVITDTLKPVIDNSLYKDFGFSCSSSTAFDLRLFAKTRSGVHASEGNIIIDNTYCIPTNATVSVNINPKYTFVSSSHAPISIVGNTVTWNLSNVSAINGKPQYIHYTAQVPGPWLTPGDTVKRTFIVMPTVGDMDTSNNATVIIDTVKSSYDPNFIAVSPEGCISPGSELEYTVGFENTGNDTAHNIYIMDTLSNDLDISSLRLVTSSALMNITKIKSGGYQIVKFEFPNIMLPDSSHHDACHGMFIYRIKTKSGLADGTLIGAYVGIYFDINPVVITDACSNTIDVSPTITISGSNNVCIGNTISLTPSISGGLWSSSSSNATVSGGIITGITTGTTVISYAFSSACKTITATFPINIVDCSLDVNGYGGIPSHYKIYPNPVKNQLTIENVLGCEIVLTDIVGRKVIRTSITNTIQNIDISNIPTGFYLLEILGNDGQRTIMKVTKN